MTKDKDPLQISLVDTATGDVVAFGPLSSENIMVLVLDGLYCGTKQKDKKEFENHIVRQRDGKGPLLKGKLVIQLTDGVGYLQDISFTDNSSWTPSKKFRLAVCCETEGIQEGISDPFRVKELRSARKSISISVSVSFYYMIFYFCFIYNTLHEYIENN